MGGPTSMCAESIGDQALRLFNNSDQLVQSNQGRNIVQFDGQGILAQKSAKPFNSISI